MQGSAPGQPSGEHERGRRNAEDHRPDEALGELILDRNRVGGLSGERPLCATGSTIMPEFVRTAECRPLLVSRPKHQGGRESVAESGSSRATACANQHPQPARADERQVLKVDHDPVDLTVLGFGERPLESGYARSVELTLDTDDADVALPSSAVELILDVDPETRRLGETSATSFSCVRAMKEVRRRCSIQAFRTGSEPRCKCPPTTTIPVGLQPSAGTSPTERASSSSTRLVGLSTNTSQIMSGSCWLPLMNPITCSAGCPLDYRLEALAHHLLERHPLLDHSPAPIARRAESPQPGVNPPRRTQTTRSSW